MAIGAAARNVAVANAVASLCFLAAILFGGFLLNKDQIPYYVRWIAQLSFVNYGYEVRLYRYTSAWSVKRTAYGISYYP